MDGARSTFRIDQGVLLALITLFALIEELLTHHLPFLYFIEYDLI